MRFAALRTSPVRRLLPSAKRHSSHREPGAPQVPCRPSGAKRYFPLSDEIFVLYSSRTNCAPLQNGITNLDLIEFSHIFGDKTRLSARLALNAQYLIPSEGQKLDTADVKCYTILHLKTINGFTF